MLHVSACVCMMWNVCSSSVLFILNGLGAWLSGAQDLLIKSHIELYWNSSYKACFRALPSMWLAMCITHWVMQKDDAIGWFNMISMDAIGWCDYYIFEGGVYGWLLWVLRRTLWYSSSTSGSAAFRRDPSSRFCVRRFSSSSPCFFHSRTPLMKYCELWMRHLFEGCSVEHWSLYKAVTSLKQPASLAPNSTNIALNHCAVCLDNAATPP